MPSHLDDALYSRHPDAPADYERLHEVIRAERPKRNMARLLGYALCGVGLLLAVGMAAVMLWKASAHHLEPKPAQITDVGSARR